MTLATGEIGGGDAAAAKAFQLYGHNFAKVLGPPLGALVGASSVVGFRYRALPVWLNGLGVLILASMVVLSPGLGAGASMVWLVLASLVLFARSAPPVAAFRDQADRSSSTPAPGERSLAADHVGR